MKCETTMKKIEKLGSWNGKSVLERFVLNKYAECTSQRLKRTSGARVMIFVFDEHWRTFKKVDLRVSNLKKSEPTGVELKKKWTYGCRTLKKVDLRVSNFKKSGPTGVELLKKWTYGCRTLKKVDLRVSNF